MIIINLCQQLIKFLYNLSDFVYWLAGLPVNLIAAPIRHLRSMIDSILDVIFGLLKPISCLANMSGGFIYNLYHGSILGMPQYLIVDFITAIPSWKKYSWMKWCTESRLNLIMSFIYKTLTRPLLFIPIIGWCLWIITLPIMYLLKLHALWTAVCPVRNMEAFMAPSTFPAMPSDGGSYPLPF